MKRALVENWSMLNDVKKFKLQPVTFTGCNLNFFLSLKRHPDNCMNQLILKRPFSNLNKELFVMFGHSQFCLIKWRVHVVVHNGSFLHNAMDLCWLTTHWGSRKPYSRPSIQYHRMWVECRKYSIKLIHFDAGEFCRFEEEILEGKYLILVRDECVEML